MAREHWIGYGGLQQHVVHAENSAFQMRTLQSFYHWPGATFGGSYHASWLGIVALGNGLDLKLCTHQVVGTLKWYVDNCFRTKGHANPSCFVCFNRTIPTMPSTYSSSSNAYTTYFVPGYGISRHIMFTVRLLSAVSH